MPRNQKSDHRLSVHFGNVDKRPGAERRAQSIIAKIHREQRRSVAAAQRNLQPFEKDFRSKLAKLIGMSGMRELTSIRTNRKLTRARRIRQSLAALQQFGIDREQIRELRQPYLVLARDVLSGFAAGVRYPPPFDGPCESPWVTYTAPFNGYVWWYNWNRTSGPVNPTFARYQNIATGTIGSAIVVSDYDAGDDDHLNAEYYTGFNVWHTPLVTGPLEVYVAFEFESSAYEGSVEDEFGFSDVTHSQGASARMTAVDIQNPVQSVVLDSSMFGFTDFLWGDDDSWTREVARSRDVHWYFFKTAATFQQGSTVLLEGGLFHNAWFDTNDETVFMKADLKVRLDRIMVRSCKPEIIL